MITDLNKPQRALTYIKHTYPTAQFENTAHLYWQWFLYKHQDISKPDILRELLASPEAGFSREQAEEILTAAMTDKKWKEELTATTQAALDKGAFGAPFFWVVKTDGHGRTVAEEPFLGVTGNSSFNFFLYIYKRLYEFARLMVG